jgi:hypothetical protein
LNVGVAFVSTQVVDFANYIRDPFGACQEISQQQDQILVRHVDMLYKHLAGASPGLKLGYSARDFPIVVVDRDAMHQSVAHDTAGVEVVDDNDRLAFEPVVPDFAIEHIQRELSAGNVPHVGCHETSVPRRPTGDYPNQLLKIELDRVPHERYDADRAELSVVHAGTEKASNDSVVGVRRAVLWHRSRVV